MFRSHLLVLAVFAALVSAVLAVLSHDTPAAQRRFALRACLVFLGGVLAAAWLMARLRG